MRKASLSQKAMENQTELVCQQQGKGYDNVFEDSFQWAGKCRRVWGLCKSWDYL